MKYLILIAVLLFTTILKAQEISLFNSEGAPIAYMDTDDDDMTIYLWNGNPVAYLSGDNIYGFNGKHLGWWIKGIVRDHKGDSIGALKSAFIGYTEYEPYKEYKKYKPYKSFKEYPPYRPYWSNYWSDNSFKIFLLQGIND
ncbi:hypothetical protein HNP38_000193 [Chryseobacterium defluvii]|uniref:4-fold beta flower domain-containing protein n=1 Tax=Chryseobacterium defluvii TaxID=160396 RepID=A0A840K5T5_9FLAO|nr:hypothetical protein [Chryseobacterium defluvii]MBB4804921.1 hypothetical protein [Chryseobacterium defluvii]